MEDGSLDCLELPSGPLSAILAVVEVFREIAGSFGGGGRGDRILLAPLGGGAMAMVFDCTAAESMPVPLDGLFFTFILMVSPS